MSYHDDLKAFVDGELDASRAEEVRLAIARDPGLAREADELRHLSAAFQSLPQPEPVGLDQTLRALRLAEKRAAPRSPWGWWLGISLAGAGGLVMMLSAMFHGGGSYDLASGSAAADVASAPLEEAAESANKSYVAKGDQRRATLSAPAAGAAAPSKAAAAADKEQKARLRDKEMAGAFSRPADPTTKARSERPTANGADLSKGRSSKEKATGTPAVVSPVPETAGESAVAKTSSPELLQLKVASIPETEAALKQFAAQNGYAIANVAETDSNKQTLVLNVPEEEAEKVLSRIKKVPQQLESRTALRSTNQHADAQGKITFGSGGLGGGGFGGAGGGRGGGAAGPAGAPAQAPKAEVGKKLKGPVRTIKIVLVRKPAQPSHKEMGNESG